MVLVEIAGKLKYNRCMNNKKIDFAASILKTMFSV